MSDFRNVYGVREWRLQKVSGRPDSRYLAELGLLPMIARILYQRGLTDTTLAKAFLRPRLRDLHSPDQLPGIVPATEALCLAIRARQKILIYGDYDVDGITGCAVLYRVLHALKANVQPYIPNRFEDGYGLQVGPLERIFAGAPESRPTIVVTVDNGVMAFEAAEMLASKSVSLIISDHHRMDDSRLPIAQAILHPKLPSSSYPNKNLCGAGVAFKLAWATAQRFHGGGRLPKALKDLLLESMALVAMGTVADVMPLTGENRIFVSHGLRALQARPSEGLRALLEKCRLPKDRLSAASISFQLAPRINAAGRLGSGLRAFNLLISEAQNESRELAQELDSENNTRREIELCLAEEASRQVVEVYGENPKMAGLVTAKAGWHEGVVGIVASRLVDRYSRPSIVLAILENGRAKGSGRSVLGVDLKAALDDCAHLLTRYGGHEAAVGLQLEAAAENLAEFRAQFARAVARQMGHESGVEIEIKAPALKLAAEVKIDEISETVCSQLEMLEPYGYGNPRPTFLGRVELSGAPRLLGKEKKHLSFFISGGGKRVRCLMWNGADWFDELDVLSRRPRSHDRSFRIAFQPKIHTWRGHRSVELTVQDLKF